MMYNVSKAVAIGLCLWYSLQAQSVLSVQYPGGLPLAHSTGPSLSLGGAGVGVQNDFFGMADNIANLGGMTRTVYSAVTSVDFTMINQDGESSGFIALSPRLFSFAFPLTRFGTFGFSLDKRSAFKLHYETVVQTPEVTKLLAYSRRGGLTSWQAGWGYSIGRRAYVGLGYERIYLINDDITKYSAELSSGAPRYDSVNYSFGGNAVRFGVMAPVRKFNLGMSGEYCLKGEATRRTNNTKNDSGATRLSLALPPSLSVGASYAASPEWLTAVSLGYTFWQRYSSEASLGLPVSNALSFSAGAQYIPASNQLSPRYWEIMQYRGGVRYARLPAATASEMALSLGLGLPLQQGGGLADLVFEIGRRSDSKYTKYSENFFRIMIGINGGREWFQSTGTRY